MITFCCFDYLKSNINYLQITDVLIEYVTLMIFFHLP